MGRLENLVAGLRGLTPGRASGGQWKAQAWSDTPVTVRLRILSTTDLHSTLLPYDYFTDRPTAPQGLCALAGGIQRQRAEARNVLLFDSGDILQGNPLADYVAQERGVGPMRPHPAIAAMNALGYDAATPGNHDFDYGQGFLRKAMSGAAFPVVCANAQSAAALARGQDPAIFPAHAILSRTVTDDTGQPHQVRIGVIGFLPPQTSDWTRPEGAEALVTRAIPQTAAIEVPRLRAAGADLVVALCHAGLTAPGDGREQENAGALLAQVPGIDLILLGHAHRVFPGPDYAGLCGVDARDGTIHGVPAVMSGFAGSHLGVCDLSLTRGAEGWRVARHAVTTVSMAPPAAPEVCPATTPECSAVEAAVTPAHVAALKFIRRPVGRTAVAIQSYFAQIAPSPALQLIADAQRWRLGALWPDSGLPDLPLLSSASAFRSGGFSGPNGYTDIAAGPLSQRNLADLYLYPNTLCALVVTGAVLRDWLDRAAAMFLPLAPGLQDQPLLDPAFAGHDFDVIDGISYRIDLRLPPRFRHDGSPCKEPRPSRITSLRVDGKAVRPDDRFVLATSSYRMGGGGNFPGIGRHLPHFDSGETTRDILARYIRSHAVIAPQTRESWGFVPIPDTSALFQTGPGSSIYLDSLPPGRLTPLGHAGDGALRYRLDMAR